MLIFLTSGNPCISSTDGRVVRVILEKAVKGCLVAVKGSLVAVNLFVTDRVISLAANIGIVLLWLLGQDSICLLFIFYLILVAQSVPKVSFSFCLLFLRKCE